MENYRDLGDISNIEDEYAKQLSNEAYGSGFQLGKEAGRQEGYNLGTDRGAKVGAEVGFYGGYARTCIELLKTSDKHNDPKTVRTINKLNEVLELVDSFPHSNETICEKKLADIRVKMKNLGNLNIQRHSHFM